MEKIGLRVKGWTCLPVLVNGIERRRAGYSILKSLISDRIEFSFLIVNINDP